MKRLKLPDRDSSRPRLDRKDVKLVQELGLDGIRGQARDMVEEKLKEQPENDGSQTPLKGNPVYKAMHACNASSRQELSRAHRIPAGKDLTGYQIDAIVDMLTRWIAREYNFYHEEKKEQRQLGEFGKA